MADELRWLRIAREYFNYPGSMGHFFHLLCQAIQIADLENTARFRKGFPELVAYVKGEKPTTEKEG